MTASPLKPAFLARYIDDYAGIWTHGQEALDDFFGIYEQSTPKSEIHDGMQQRWARCSFLRHFSENEIVR